MMEWLGLIVDIVMIVVVGAGVVQAIRLIRQLQDLRASRTEMERFVRDFNSAVMRAEAGIKALRSAARESGDDLEKLVEKAIMVRDELNFIVESADGVAERLSNSAADVMHADQKQAQKVPPPARTAPPVEQRTPNKPASAPPAPPVPEEKPPASRAENELLQALKKLSGSNL